MVLAMALIKCEGHGGVFFHVTEVKHSDIFVGTEVEFEVVGSGKGTNSG